MRRKCLLAMVILGLFLWPAVLCAGAQQAADRYTPAVFNLQEKLSDQQLAQATGHGHEKARPCQDGKIILWDEWNRAKPASMNNAGNQGQVIIGGSPR
ncbi:MAG: hypothetical protein M0P73_08260 [Syntrophobacterales bacterium]|nr:hypothetical protein [Syntrophobacterales bacterium]